jgi:hypothetical protein
MKHDRFLTRSLPNVSLFAAIILTITVFMGCSDIGAKMDPLGLRGFGKKPVRIATTKLEYLPAPLLLVPRHSMWCDNISFHLNHPVCFNLLTPRQIEIHLATGRANFALLSADDFARIVDSPDYEMLAVPINKYGKTRRQGLLIVSAQSPLQAVHDLKGQVLHMMPEGDPLNEAVLGLLLEAGIIDHGPDENPVGVTIKNRKDVEAIIDGVLEDPGSGGIIPAAEYEQWKEARGKLDVTSPTKDQVHVLARTVVVPNGPFVASKKNSVKLTEKMRKYLLEKAGQGKLILAPMGFTGFAPPLDKADYQSFFEVYEKVRVFKSSASHVHMPLNDRQAPAKTK